MKVDVFHKNSTIKSNLIGKCQLDLHMTSFDEGSVTALHIYNKKLNKVVGMVYLRLKYEPMSIELLDEEWLLELKMPQQIDKYNYFNDFLVNEFKNACHFGYLEVELIELHIPKTN